MVFSNLIFLYLFLPVCLIFYFLCQNIRAKNAVLIVFSLIFYAWGEPVYLLLMLASVAVNWGFGLLIERRRKKVFLILALVLDLGCLAVFKYAGFFVENLNALFRISLAVPQIPLPIGISFYTFQALSYTVDVWRGDVPAQRSFAKLLLYISLFPQLIAGAAPGIADCPADVRRKSLWPPGSFIRRTGLAVYMEQSAHGTLLGACGAGRSRLPRRRGAERGDSLPHDLCRSAAGTGASAGDRGSAGNRKSRLAGGGGARAARCGRTNFAKNTEKIKKSLTVNLLDTVR